MNTPMERPRAGLTDYLAAERTFLAWIRTGLALMGFGFVVARFGFFLQELRIAQHIPAVPSSGISTGLGTALVVAGVIVNLLSAWQHARLIRRLDRGESSPAPSFKTAVAVAIFLALFGLAMAIYLISVRGSAKSQSENFENRQETHLWRLLKTTELPTKPAIIPSTKPWKSLKASCRQKG